MQGDKLLFWFIIIVYVDVDPTTAQANIFIEKLLLWNSSELYECNTIISIFFI